MSKDILIIIGEGYTVAGAIIELQNRLNNMLAEYDYINPIVIYLNRHETSVSNSVRAYAIQMVRRKS